MERQYPKQGRAVERLKREPGGVTPNKRDWPLAVKLGKELGDSEPCLNISKVFSLAGKPQGHITNQYSPFL